MTETMLERVADAVLTDLGQRKRIGAALDDVDDVVMVELRQSIGRAAIEAMREPTEAMESAPTYKMGDDTSAIWRAMIDAALKDTQP